MKALLSLFLIINTVSSVKADYKRLLIHETINVSELIIEGEIIKVDSLFFTFNIHEVLKGEMHHKTLKINKFQNWSCASRWGEYQVNQRAILCLMRRNNTLEITGFGNEGEMPIEKDSLYIITPYGLMGTSRYHRYSAMKFSLREVKNGLTEYLQSKDILYKSIEDKSILNFLPLTDFLRKIQIELILKNSSQLGLSYEARDQWIILYNKPLQIQGIWVLHQVEMEEKILSADSLVNPCGFRDEIQILLEESSQNLNRKNDPKENLIIGKTDYKICTFNPETFEPEETANTCVNILYIDKSNPSIWHKIGEGFHTKYEVSLQQNFLILKEITKENNLPKILTYSKKN